MPSPWPSGGDVFPPSGLLPVYTCRETLDVRAGVSTGQEVRILAGRAERVKSVAVIADGGHVITGSYDGTAKIYEVSTGLEVQTFAGHAYAVLSVAVFAGGEHVITGSYDSTAKIWEMNTGRLAFRPYR